MFSGRVFCVVLCLHISTYSAQHSDISDHILKEIKAFANNGLGIDAFEKYLKTMTYKYTPITSETVTKLAGGIQNKLDKFKSILKTIKTDILGAYRGASSETQPPINCADVSTTSSHPVLGSDVDLNTWCITGDVLGESNNNNFLSGAEFLPKWKEIFKETKGMKYIKFGNEEGVLYNYPAKHYKVPPEGYDPRFRQWYVEPVTSYPKDLVLMIDKSLSMNAKSAGTPPVITLAINAAKTVVDTLNHNDRIAVISFGNDAQTPNKRACYSTDLAKATEVAKMDIKEFLDNIEASDTSTYYTKAIDKGFSMLSNTKPDLFDTRKRDKIIIFLTDGDATDNEINILATLERENAKLNNTVVLLTFGIGTGILNENLLKKMAQQDFIDGNDVTRGHYTRIKQPDNLRYSMASYYDYFKRGGINDEQFSVPYSDAFGTGPQISMCLPFDYNGKLEGVYCIDVALEYLLSDVTYFRDDDGTYGFIIDSQGRVLSHPQSPNIAELSTDFFFVHLATVEYGEPTSMDFIRQNMTRGGSYHKAPEWSVRITPSGSGTGQDVSIMKITPTYFWHPIDGTNFSVAIVTTKPSKIHFKWNGNMKNIWYHTDNKQTSKENICKDFSRIAAKGRIATFLSNRCFDDPYGYAYYKTITESKISSFLSGRTNDNPGIKNGIRDTVMVLQQLENIWTSAEYSNFIIWRYFATRSGVIVTYPGIELPKVYDATIRPWFIGAVADNLTYYISTPYTDLWGAGTVITLSKVVSNGNYTIGVIAMDFTIESFYNSIFQNNTTCQTNECIVIDPAGYVIAHKDWTKDKPQAEDFTNIHVVRKEPLIAQYMIDSNIMQKSACVDIAKSYRELSYWKILLHGKRTVKYNGEPFFDVIPISYTNMFLIVKKQGIGDLSECTCSKPSDKCSSSSDCYCPCSKDTNAYDYCTAILHSGHGLDIPYPPCSPRIPVISYTDMLKSEKSRMQQLKLNECRDYKCSLKTGKEDCSRVLSCSWCVKNKHDVILNSSICRTPYCGKTEYCPSGKENFTPTESGCSGVTKSNEKKGLASWAIFLIVLFVAGVCIAAIVLAICYYVRSNDTINVIPDDIYFTTKGVDNPAIGDYIEQNHYDFIPAHQQVSTENQLILNNVKSHEHNNLTSSDYLSTNQVRSKQPVDNNSIQHTTNTNQGMYLAPKSTHNPNMDRLEDDDAAGSQHSSDLPPSPCVNQVITEEYI